MGGDARGRGGACASARALRVGVAFVPACARAWRVVRAVGAGLVHYVQRCSQSQLRHELHALSHALDAARVHDQRAGRAEDRVLFLADDPPAPRRRAARRSCVDRDLVNEDGRRRSLADEASRGNAQ